MITRALEISVATAAISAYLSSFVFNILYALLIELTNQSLTIYAKKKRIASDSESSSAMNEVEEITHGGLL